MRDLFLSNLQNQLEFINSIGFLGRDRVLYAWLWAFSACLTAYRMSMEAIPNGRLGRFLSLRRRISPVSVLLRLGVTFCPPGNWCYSFMGWGSDGFDNY